MSTRETAAELTVYYKRQRLTSLIFDTQKTADAFVETITSFFNKKVKMYSLFVARLKLSIPQNRLPGNCIVMLKAIFPPKAGS